MTRLVLFAFLTTTLLEASARADFLFASDLANGQIYKLDKDSGTLLQTIKVSQGLDSLIFNSQGNIIYSAYSVGGGGQIRMVNPSVGISSDTLLATIGNRAVDLALSPDGTRVLATSQTTQSLYVVDLVNPAHPTTTIAGAFSAGVAYDSSGRLFAVSGSNIVQLDPTTFRVIASSAALSGLDGLSFDPFTGNLFASSRSRGSSGREGFYELSLQAGNFLSASLITSSSFSSTFDPDGLESDGRGNLYLASQANRGDNKIYQYNITTGNLTALTSALPGLDDLAPLVGQGSLAVPEPASLALSIAGMMIGLGYAAAARARASARHQETAAGAAPSSRGSAAPNSSRAG